MKFIIICLTAAMLASCGSSKREKRQEREAIVNAVIAAQSGSPAMPPFSFHWDGQYANLSTQYMKCHQENIRVNRRSVIDGSGIYTDDCKAFVQQMSKCNVAWRTNEVEMIQKECFNHYRSKGWDNPHISPSTNTIAKSVKSNQNPPNLFYWDGEYTNLTTQAMRCHQEPRRVNRNSLITQSGVFTDDCSAFRGQMTKCNIAWQKNDKKEINKECINHHRSKG